MTAAVSVGSRLQNREDYTMLSISFTSERTFIYYKYIYMNNNYLYNDIYIYLYIYIYTSLYTYISYAEQLIVQEIEFGR